MDDADVDRNSPSAHVAAAQGDVNTLVYAIQQDPSLLEQQDADGLTPLAHAVLSNQLQTVKILVKMGTSINVVDNVGRTCLAMAAYQGWYDGVRFLLHHGAKQNIFDKSGRSPLHASTYDSETRTMGLLLQNLSKAEINQKDNEGMSALHWAAFHNRPDHVQLLVLKGADVFAKDMDGKTALHWAAQNGSVSCITALLRSQNANKLINMVDGSGKTAVHFAAAAGHYKVIRELAGTAGCQLETLDPDERTPIHWAAATGQSKCVATLLKLGVNANVHDCDGATPLEYARQCGHEECVRLLEYRVIASDKKKMKSTGKEQKTSSEQKLNVANKSGHSKNPFGFIVDFFKSKSSSKEEQDISSERVSTVANSPDFDESEGSGTSTLESGDFQKQNDYGGTSLKSNKDSGPASVSENAYNQNNSDNGQVPKREKNSKGKIVNSDRQSLPVPLLRHHHAQQMPADAEFILGLQLGYTNLSARSDTPKSQMSSVSDGALLPLRTPGQYALSPVPSLPPSREYQLAPIKGAKPKLGASYPPPNMNNRVASLSHEAGLGRPPTPPSWDNNLKPQNRHIKSKSMPESSLAIDGFKPKEWGTGPQDGYHKHKKHKKKKQQRALNVTEQDHGTKLETIDLSSDRRKEHQKQSNRKDVDMESYKKLDKSIQNLLH
ncbi:ankyrin repeat domain-containing protein 55 [Lingula anatina]|uniref:Ankyrin repeat domain-containing protein 55 n=1 Tax=Lingula anatina TaxID=7574 RepID=A0A1S3JGC6_LINAN|nr:ankyrin repeat domain-containing protein 55 [Lingula anatina]XP_013409460.1 ankyrin repeat domain-containing protein 55 [Lingula anatina]XP_013409461.1 ankyrin repeat domain-containing protein 55 [Lingula anatina]|eukprot:XP_013409459.1 ankyrin repeat domain-containing protein 55 [Lingula anatina]